MTGRFFALALVALAVAGTAAVVAELRNAAPLEKRAGWWL